MFKTSIGADQGRPLSPRLFSIYFEDLIYELKMTSLKTRINEIKTGVIIYANNLVVLSNSKEKMQEMLIIIEKYCKKWEIKINGKKTQYMKVIKIK